MAIGVYIDQGHNPQNPNAGAEGYGFREQDLVWRIGAELYRLLAADSNFVPRLSRPTPDTAIGTSTADSLRRRVAEAEAFGANLFLSLHTNASSLPAANGSEALVFSAASPAYRIGEVLLREMTALTGTANRGVELRPGLYVLRRTSMPSVLMELGFITNAGDAALMNSRPDLFAQGLYNGLRSYYGV